MATDYKIRIYDTSGVLQAEFVDFLTLAYSKVVNDPGLGTFVISGENPAIDLLTDKSQVEFWRRNREQDIDWTCDFYGLYREPDRRGARPGVFTATCPGQMSLLSRRIVAWKAGTNNRSKFIAAPAETVMKTLVDYNAAANATTANGRERAGVIGGITVEADGGGGNTVDWYCAYENLLESLQGLASIGGGDFDLVKTAAAAWQFRWYTGQLGTDRSSSVVFSLGYDNMSDPRFRTRRLGEKSAAIVGGQGEGAARAIAVRTGANYSAANDIEVFVDARDVSTVEGLETRGDQALAMLRALDEFDFDVLQTAASAYGKHYGLGDLVTAVSPYSGLGIVRKIRRVTVAVSRRGEQIGVETADV
jgi:hypothetical protein